MEVDVDIAEKKNEPAAAAADFFHRARHRRLANQKFSSLSSLWQKCFKTKALTIINVANDRAGL
jgi:hypothetical protein